MSDNRSAEPSPRPAKGQPHPTGAADPVSTQAEVRALAQKMYDFRFSACAGTPRSQEYKAGFMAGLLSRLAGETITYPYQTGTAAADAYLSGIEHGRDRAAPSALTAP